MLDAPELQDDFYLNLVDWSAQNVLAVGLGSCVYLWSACTSQVTRTSGSASNAILNFRFLQVTRLCDLSSDANTVTSVSWSERGHQLAVGTHHGYVTVWDVAASKQVSLREGGICWGGGQILTTGVCVENCDGCKKE